MNLFEILNSAVSYEVTKETADLFKTQAKIGKRVIVFTASKEEDGDDSWHIEFRELTPEKPAGTIKATGSGNGLEVLSMVRSSLQEFVERYAPRMIHFSADTTIGAARSKVYSRLKIPNYTMDRIQGMNDDSFILKRTS